MKKGAVSNQITFNNKLGGTSPHLPPPPLSPSRVTVSWWIFLSLSIPEVQSVPSLSLTFNPYIARVTYADAHTREQYEFIYYSVLIY